MIFNDLALFITVARCQNFSKAANELNITPSRMSRRIADLETHLGVKLFERTTRQVRLTEEGRLLLDKCQAPIEELEGVGGSLSHSEAQTIRMTAPSLAARVTIAPKLLAFMKQNPQIKIELISSNHYLDFIRDNIDLAFRVGPLPEENVIAKKIWTIPNSFCATDSFLEKYNLTVEIGYEDFLGLPAITHRAGWRVEEEGNIYPSNIVHSFDDLEMIQKAAQHDFGVAMLPDDMIIEGLKKIFVKGLTPEKRHMYVVYPSRRLLPQRVRDLIDYMSC